MWFGSCDALLDSALVDLDNYHVFPHSEEGRRAVRKISENFRDSYIYLGYDGFYVALSSVARDKIVKKLREKLQRKEEKLQIFQEEVEDLRQAVGVFGE